MFKSNWMKWFAFIGVLIFVSMVSVGCSKKLVDALLSKFDIGEGDASIEFTVTTQDPKDANKTIPLPGARIFIRDDVEPPDGGTDEKGVCLVGGLKAGNQWYRVKYNEYYSYDEGYINVVSKATQKKSVVLKQYTNDQYNQSERKFSFTVTNSSDGKPISGATCWVYIDSKTGWSKVTGDNGQVIVDAVKYNSDNYYYAIQKDDFEYIYDKTITCAAGQTATIKESLKAAQQAKTKLEFTIKDSKTQAPVTTADVSLKYWENNSPRDITLSVNASGVCTFDIPFGKYYEYNVNPNNQQYGSKGGKGNITGEGTTKINVSLDAAVQTNEVGKLQVTVKDGYLKTGVQGATVKIYEDNKTFIEEKTTDQNGICTFEGLKVSGKKLDVFKIGYDDRRDVWTDIQANQTKPIEIELKNNTPAPGSSWMFGGNIGSDFLRYKHTAVTDGTKIYVFGGQQNENGAAANIGVGYFSDGNNWQKLEADNNPLNGQALPAVGSHASVFFTDSKIYVIGGIDANGQTLSKVYYSTDGREWMAATTEAAFGKRKFHSSVVFKLNNIEKMYMIGGANENGVATSDVWSSTDGKDWQSVTLNAAFGARQKHVSVVFDNRIWVIGGQDGNNSFKTDIWYSYDGANWTQATQNAEFGMRGGHQVVVFRNTSLNKDELILLSGSDGQTTKDDVWHSSDGIHWYETNIFQRVGPRTNHAAIVFKDKIYIIGGKDGLGSIRDDYYRTY